VLFQSPTIEQLAGRFTDDRREESWSCLFPVQEEGSRLPFTWVHGDGLRAIDMFGRLRYWRTRDTINGSVERVRWRACVRRGTLLPPSLRSPYILDLDGVHFVSTRRRAIQASTDLQAWHHAVPTADGLG
jgi:hypothetical protein